MDYTWHYNKLIETRKDREIVKGCYYEKHHIIMKSMGGTDEETNLIHLTPREHFLAHWLLWRIHRNRQTAYAFNTFTNFFTGNNHINRPKITSSRGYSEAREAYSKLHSERMKGVLNSNRSKVVIQYDMEGNFIKEWPSAKEAHRELKISHITSCCRGERNLAGNFKWKYKIAKLEKSKQYNMRKTNNVTNRKSIIQFDSSDNKIAEFKSISEAVRLTGVPKSSIQSNIAGILLHAGGFIWKVNTINN